MIIENINNMENNNNSNRSSINYQKIKYILQKLFFFIVIFLHICLITYKLYINDIIIKKNKLLFNNDPIVNNNLLNNKRDLDFEIKNNTNYNHSKEEEIVEKIIKDYSFLINLTSNNYSGNWSHFSFKKNSFFDENIKEGEVKLYFEKANINSNSLPPEDRVNLMNVNINIKEGKYSDKLIRINYTFPINNKNIQYLDDGTIIINNTNINLKCFNLYYYIYLISKETINRTNITLILKREEHIYSPTFKIKNYSPFNNVKLIISSDILKLNLDTAIAHDDEIQKVRIYAFFLSFFGILEIYYCSKLINKINLQNDIAKKISTITILINCCIKLVICIIHFYLSVKPSDEDEGISYQYGIVTIIYFFGFTGFELKLLLLVFKIKNNLRNRNLYRRRLLSLYIMFYIIFVIISINMKQCITNFNLITIVYTLSWLSQILVSVCQNSRPPIPRLYIVWSSLSRLYLPIYAKGFKYNCFNLRPSYLKVLLLIIITFIEAIILLLQKSLGPRIIIPKKFRKQNQVFDYYKDKVNIQKHVSQNPICVICLENLSVDVDENFNRIKKAKKPKTIGNKIMSIFYLDILNEKIKKCLKYLEGKNIKKKYMITPCDHVFHTVCLEKWIKLKSECPYCKTNIPPID